MLWHTLRLFCAIWRFQTLPIAFRFFNGQRAPLWLTRPFFGYRLHLDVSRSAAQQLLFLAGKRFIEERSLLKELVKPGMTVVDVGANIGYYLLMLERYVGSQGTVWAIEPSPENLPELETNIGDNQLRNVHLFKVALGAVAGTEGLKGGINSGVVEGAEGRYACEVMPLHSMVTENIDFLKIDVDGYELEVLYGAEQTLCTMKPRLLLEFHPLLVGRRGQSFGQVHSFLARNYRDIRYFDVLDNVGLGSKIASRYWNRSLVRELDGPPAEPMHRGRVYGTFGIVCR